MKIAIGFFGILYGHTTKQYDIRHCWPNLSKMIVEPLKEHNVEILLSTYKVNDENIEKEIYDIIKPNIKYISDTDINSSNSRTTKFAMFNLLENKDYDFVIMTRTDLHFSKNIKEMNIDYNKFNFLFHEKDRKHDNLTCDNFYAWPYKMTKNVEESFKTSTAANFHDTHKLFEFLIKNISQEEIHYIAGEEEHLSDVNKYFTICKPGYTDRFEIIHEEVRERFNYTR